MQKEERDSQLRDNRRDRLRGVVSGSCAYRRLLRSQQDRAMAWAIGEFWRDGQERDWTGAWIDAAGDPLVCT